MPAAESSEAGFESIPVVESGLLLQSDFAAGEIVEYLRFKKSFLRRIRPEMANQRRNWQRFVLIKADKDSGAGDASEVVAGSDAADRPPLQLAAQLPAARAESLCRKERGDVQWFAMWSYKGTNSRFVPRIRTCALGYVQLGKGETFADYVVGRVAHISIET